MHFQSELCLDDDIQELITHQFFFCSDLHQIVLTLSDKFVKPKIFVVTNIYRLLFTKSELGLGFRETVFDLPLLSRALSTSQIRYTYSHSHHRVHINFHSLQCATRGLGWTVSDNDVHIRTLNNFSAPADLCSHAQC